MKFSTLGRPDESLVKTLASRRCLKWSQRFIKFSHSACRNFASIEHSSAVVVERPSPGSLTMRLTGRSVTPGF